MRENKFILYDGKILLGKVVLHRHLLPKNFQMSLVHGGGFFSLDRDSKTVTLYGRSGEFGGFNRTSASTFELPSKLDGFTVLIASCS